MEHAARRCAIALLAAAGLCLPVFGLLAAGLPVNNDPEAWLPAGDPGRAAYAAFRRTFGTEEAILVVLPAAAGAGEGEAEIEALRLRLEDSPHVRYACSPGSVGAVMADLGVPPDEIVRRQTGLLRGADGSRIAVAAVLSAAGAADRPGAVADVRRAVNASGFGAAAGVAGVPVVVAELDRLSRPAVVLPYVVGMLLAGLAVLKFVCGRWGLALTLAGVVVWAVLGTLAGVRVCGGEMNLILAALPPLVLVFALTAGIHLLHYHAAVPAGLTRLGASTLAVRDAAAPTAWATATTVAGLLSLTLSDVRPVAQFGAAGAFGAVLAAVGGLLFTPAAVLLCGGLPKSRRPGAKTVRHAAAVLRHRKPILIAAAVTVAACAAGLPRVSAKLDAADLLPPSGCVAADHRTACERVTPPESIELVLRPDAGTPFTASLDRVRGIERRLRGLPAVRHVLSAATFLGDGEGVAAANALSEARRRPEAAAFVTADGSAWRISVRADMPPGERAAVVAELEAAAGNDAVTVTGLAPLLERAERAIHDGFRDSVFAAALVIALAVMLAVGDWRVWLAAVLANAAPLAAVFGLLGWAGVPVDVGLMMTASVALGLAVDGTFHLLAVYRAGSGGPTAAAAALAASGPAVARAALVAGAGMLVLTVSPFPPTARFGWLTIALLAAAVGADLLLLPALLAGLSRGASADRPRSVPFRLPAVDWKAVGRRAA